MLEIFKTEDGNVMKYIHDDGSETAIKLSKSHQDIFNPLTKKMEHHTSERNKYSIFISSSVGCFMKCKFCHLTLKESKFLKLSGDEILENLKEAIEDAVLQNPNMKDRFVKLSWMGMGDALNKSSIVKDITIRLLDWIFENKYASGLDGVDLSSVLPDVNDEWIFDFHEMEILLEKYNTNPVYSMDNVEYTNGFYSHRNKFRLFYSIGSAIQENRDIVIPNAMKIEKAKEKLIKYIDNNKYTLIFHHLLVDGLNDSEKELEELKKLMSEFNNCELRILRYNSCLKGDLKESETLINQVKNLSESINFLKVQVSPGKEVQAACGQFIVKDFIKK